MSAQEENAISALIEFARVSQQLGMASRILEDMDLADRAFDEMIVCLEKHLEDD